MGLFDIFKRPNRVIDLAEPIYFKINWDDNDFKEFVFGVVDGMRYSRSRKFPFSLELEFNALLGGSFLNWYLNKIFGCDNKLSSCLCFRRDTWYGHDFYNFDNELTNDKSDLVLDDNKDFRYVFRYNGLSKIYYIKSNEVKSIDLDKLNTFTLYHDMKGHFSNSFTINDFYSDSDIYESYEEAYSVLSDKLDKKMTNDFSNLDNVW